MTVPIAVIISVFLPLKHESSNALDKMKKIDYGGIVLNIGSTLLLLIPLSGGGVTYAWSSSFFIGATIAGIFLTVFFVIYEWKIAPLPIMPLRLYRAPHCWALYLQSFIIGLAYFGNIFYFPIYFQSVLHYSPLVSGALIMPIIITTSFGSISSGQYMTRVGSYMHCILVGFTLWTLGNGLTLLFNRDTGLALLIPILILEGFGIGLTLQPTMVGMYANSRVEDRAVTTGLRNFIRTIGGAFGLVISGVILSNTLRAGLAHESFISTEILTELLSSTHTLDDLDLTQDQTNQILDVYMSGLHYIFIFFTICSSTNLLLTFWVGNTSLKPRKEQDAEEPCESESSTRPPTSVSAKPTACSDDDSFKDEDKTGSTTNSKMVENKE